MGASELMPPTAVHSPLWAKQLWSRASGLQPVQQQQQLVHNRFLGTGGPRRVLSFVNGSPLQLVAIPWDLTLYKRLWAQYTLDERIKSAFPAGTAGTHVDSSLFLAQFSAPPVPPPRSTALPRGVVWSESLSRCAPCARGLSSSGLIFRTAGSSTAALVRLPSELNTTTLPALTTLAMPLQLALYDIGAVVHPEQQHTEQLHWKRAVLPPVRAELLQYGIAVLHRAVLPSFMQQAMRAHVAPLAAQARCAWIKAPPIASFLCDSLTELVSSLVDEPVRGINPIVLSYQPGCALKAHYDSSLYTYGTTLSLGPLRAGDHSMPLGLSSTHASWPTHKEATLQSGEMAVFNASWMHWREPWPEQHSMLAIQCAFQPTFRAA
eukprot:TRINITY_DN28790_c0_g1_i1.p1 TRINITY_DN28790_c0_g1~~TRINITY_DN28790_c0_g1_i1.p1  ORF type:complete len:378 (+),score=90.57 TRINITY_DN28790_c0_g1_i1:236-1369(+)